MSDKVYVHLGVFVCCVVVIIGLSNKNNSKYWKQCVPILVFFSLFLSLILFFSLIFYALLWFAEKSEFKLKGFNLSIVCPFSQDWQQILMKTTVAWNQIRYICHSLFPPPSSPIFTLLLGTLPSTSPHWWGNVKLPALQHPPAPTPPPFLLWPPPLQPWDRRFLEALNRWMVEGKVAAPRHTDPRLIVGNILS